MFSTYKNPVYEYIKSPDQSADKAVHHPVIVVGAGPVGMGAAMDLGQYGNDVLVLDDNNTVSVGSRAICFSKRALEIFDRLGCAEPMIDKGVTWNVGKIFFRDELVTQFDLLPEAGHKMPAFINLQQYYLEEYMVDRLNQLETIETRWKNKVITVEQDDDIVSLTIDTPDGKYDLSCDWLIVADGANSDVRAMMGLESTGKVFKDRFLIADIVMKAGFPPERWFNFDPSYHRGQSTLLHRQSDDVWRLDFQLGWDKDPEEEKKPENIIPRVKAMMGDDVDFELEWASVYTFQCRRMQRFRQGRVLFTGDAAHQVSPFGARGANSGLQDTDNLIWKLKLVMQQKAPQQLLDTYCDEREFAADENIMNSTRSTDFITPKSAVSKYFRDATLELSKRFDFARKLTNSGRLSDTAVLLDSTLNTPDEDSFEGDMVPGTVMSDAPVVNQNAKQWLLNSLGNHFTCLIFVNSVDDLSLSELEAIDTLQREEIQLVPLIVVTEQALTTIDDIQILAETDGVSKQRFDALPGTTYLIRPDQHVCARWRSLDADKVRQSLLRATANL
ncbi:MAG: FAD-dependent oxidoreductase [Gammaproteobacteria bacterium]|nr:FAD-dependent oxidoreductase [Gammaproteobacteria bacterium]